jgi:hypothetical protein
MSDPLGRSGVVPSFTEGNRRRLLTDDEITAICNDVRTRPLSEVGRHVMPLVTHIGVLEDRACQSCRWWVAYNQSAKTAPHGECTNRRGVSVRIIADELEFNAVPAVLTPFDWSCKGWEERASEGDDAQASCG